MKAVLFDIDNTLLVKRPTIAEKWHADLCSAGYNVTMDDTRRAFAECEMWVGEQVRRENETGIRMNDDDFLKAVVGCAIDTLGIDSASASILAPVWIGCYEKQYAIMDGAVGALNALSKRGIRLGIVSNNRPSIRNTLTELGLTAYFRTIVISEEVDLYKPDPRILLHACDQLNVLPEESIYVGDHPYDVVCAHEASVHSAWLPANEYMKLPADTQKPTFLIRSLSELADII